MQTITVKLEQRSYDIDVGVHHLGVAQKLIAALPTPRAIIISNTTVAPIYGQVLEDALNSAGVTTKTLNLPDGEAFKTLETLDSIFEFLLINAVDRNTTLIALGGGVIGDIVGFAAATYQRGMPFMQVPTTLLALVDSSVGGKTAVNHPRGKNMIGAFYQPKYVLADIGLLSTLPAREFNAGLAEVIKYGLILDATFFDWLEINIDALLARDYAALEYAVARCCEIKAKVVAADERETAKEGGRALLNLGHTFGHAIETGLGYGQWLHGEAVACGMLCAAKFSQEFCGFDAASVARIQHILERAHLPILLPSIEKLSTQDMLYHMGRDKKNEAAQIRLILLRKIGDAFVDGTHSADKISNFIASNRS
jgi:3-dehydroquinate synthase